MYLLRLVKRSALPYGALIAIVLSVALLLGRDTSWMGIWPRGSAAAQQCSFYLAAVFAAIQAVFAGTDRRAGMTDADFPAARSTLSRVASRTALGFATSVFVYSVPFLVVFVENMRNAAPAGGIWWSYYVLGLPVMAIGVSLGQVFGTLIKSDYVAPAVAAIASFVFVATLGQVMHIVAMNGDAWYDLSTPALFARLLLGAASLLAATYASHVISRKGIGWKAGTSSGPIKAVIATVALALGVIATAATPNVQVAREQPKTPLCTGTSPRMCLWPDDAKYLAEVKNMQKGMQSLPSRFKIPSQFFETGLSHPSGASEIPTSEGRLWNAANGMAISIGLDTYPSTCVPDGDDAQKKFTAANFNVLGFLLRSIYGPDKPSNGEGGGPPVDETEINNVVTSSPAAQNAWIDKQDKDIYAPPCKK